jgi:HD-GYP domain-containing protein (c-di-GMP phosphodiesterase class II)
MQRHVPNTIHFLEANDHIPKGARLIAEQHHEKLDGTGYPHGLRGKDINDLARMAAIVDVYSALTDRRVYKPAMAPPQAFEIMETQMTNHLDQGLLKLFRTIMLDTTADLLTGRTRLPPR